MSENRAFCFSKNPENSSMTQCKTSALESCTVTTVFKYWNSIVPYINNMFKPSFNRYNTRSQMTLKAPLLKTNAGQQALSFLGLKCGLK